MWHLPLVPGGIVSNIFLQHRCAEVKFIFPEIEGFKQPLAILPRVVVFSILFENFIDELQLSSGIL